MLAFKQCHGSITPRFYSAWLSAFCGFHEKRIFPLPEAGVFPLAEWWAHLTPPPPCMHPSDGEYGTAGHPPGGRSTDLVSPLIPYWLSQGNSVMNRSLPAEALETRSRVVFDPVNPSLSVTSPRPVRSPKTGSKRKLDHSQKHTSDGDFSKSRDVFLLRRSYIFLWLFVDILFVSSLPGHMIGQEL